MSKRFVLGLLGALVISVSATAEINVATEATEFPRATVGDTFGVQLVVRGLGFFTAPSLGVYDIDITFDPARVTFQSIEFGSWLDLSGLGSIRAVTPYPDYVNLLEVSLDSVEDLNNLQNPGIFVARLTFTAIGAGESLFAPRINVIGDAEGNPLIDVTVTPVTFRIQDAPPVPEPATYLLMGLGLAVLVVTRQHHKRPRRERQCVVV